MTTASSRRPCSLAKMNSATPMTSRQPARAPEIAAERFSSSGARVASIAIDVATNDPMREIAATHVGEPVDVARAAKRAGEEDAAHVRDDGGDEHERGPVVDLAHEQARRGFEREAQHRSVRAPQVAPAWHVSVRRPVARAIASRRLPRPAPSRPRKVRGRPTRSQCRAPGGLALIQAWLRCAASWLPARSPR